MKLALTGYGVVSSLGVGRDAFSAALRRPSLDGAGFRADSTVAPGRRVAEIWDWAPKEHLGAKGHRTFDRLTKFLIAAGKYALVDAGLKADGEFLPGRSSKDVGVCSATAYGSLDAIAELNRVAELEDPRYINPQRFPNTVINAAAGYVSIWEKLEAPNTTIVDGNCGSLDAVLVAETQLRHRRGRAFLVGGGEVASEPLLTALSRLGLGPAGEDLCVGEGAAYFVTETPEDAAERDATVLAYITGYGTAFDAPESEALLVHGSSRAVMESAQGAMADAGIEPGDVDLVVRATSGLAPFDAAEAAGLAEARLAETPALYPKRWIGECFGAAGAFGMAAAVEAMGGNIGSVSGDTKTVLVTTLGYYGNASSVVLRRP